VTSSIIPPKVVASRALALDALRGLAIVGMILSARIPFGENWLPGWMYHAQEGPNPRLKGADPPGFSWVDLVFPAFLFAMGAAFPLALGRRLARGQTVGRVMIFAVQRWALLVFFAIYLQNTLPWLLGGDTRANIIGFIGFLALFPVFLRLPREWPRARVLTVRAVGFTLAFGLLLLIERQPEMDFDLHRGDPIILVLANMALVGSALWLLAKRGGPWGSIAMGIGVVLALLGHISMGGEDHLSFGLAEALRPFNEHSLRWATQLLYFKYLLVVIPGMLVGDHLAMGMSEHSDASQVSLPRRTLWLVALVLLALLVWVHTALQARWGIFTSLGAFALALPVILQTWRVRTPTDRLMRALAISGAFWLAVGLALEPLEGGIKKTPSTLCYYLVSAGLSIFLLLLLTLVIDVLGKRRWGMGMLIANGQNPMLAYAGIRGLLGPFHMLTGIDRLITQPLFVAGPWIGAAWGLFKSLTLAWAVQLATKFKIVWRS
jgi:predicted acyltransferase